MSGPACIVTRNGLPVKYGRGWDGMALGPEYTQVERPLIEQLKGLGWTHLEGASSGAVRPTDPGQVWARCLQRGFS